jgi:hypothetical protein
MRMVGRARKKREAEAKADAAPTFQTVRRNWSLRVKEPRKSGRKTAMSGEDSKGDLFGSNAPAGNPIRSWLSREAYV